MGRYEDRNYNSTDGLRLHYRDYAGGYPDQPPILCLPGLTRNARDFEPVADRFAGEWRVLALDFRGRGGSAAEFSTFIASETRKWAQIIKAANITAE